MQIEKASRSDLPAVRKLYRILFSDMAALQPTYLRAASQEDAFILSAIEKEDWDILLAREGERVHGFALVQLRHTPPYTCMVPHRLAYLMDLVVEPAARNRGIGHALLDAVKAWGRERGADYVELQALSQNEGARRLYAREGFVDDMRTLRCSL